MRLQRHQRIRLVAGAVVLVCAATFTGWSDGSLALGGRGSRLGAAAALLMTAGAGVGVAGSWRVLMRPDLTPLGRAAALPWLVCYAALALAGVGVALWQAQPAVSPLWAGLPVGLAAGAYLAAAVAERVGLREGLAGLPLLAVFGLAAGAAGSAGGDPRYLQALLATDVVVVPLLVALLRRRASPVPLLPDRAWFAGAAGWALTVVAVLLGHPGAAGLVAAITVGLLRPGQPPAPAHT